MFLTSLYVSLISYFFIDASASPYVLIHEEFMGNIVNNSSFDKNIKILYFTGNHDLDILKQGHMNSPTSSSVTDELISEHKKVVFESPAENSSSTNINIQSISNEIIWEEYLLLITLCITLFVILLFFKYLCSYHNRDKASCVDESLHGVQPILKPTVAGMGIIQPENRDCHLVEVESELISIPVHSPTRKEKVLLERCESNASLTLDLNPQENMHHSTPEECSALKPSFTYFVLQSAAKRLRKRQLHTNLNIEALRTEYQTYVGEMNAHVVTQDPMPQTGNDFWLMVWEEKSPVIVMITELKEEMEVKSEPYIPDYQDCYNDIEVSVSCVIPRDGYTIRELVLRKGGKTHTVHHFSYTFWTDHETSDTDNQLISMVLEVEALRRNSSGDAKEPMIFHSKSLPVTQP